MVLSFRTNDSPKKKIRKPVTAAALIVQHIKVYSDVMTERLDKKKKYKMLL
jgi:hypothetical protein